jgi:hypothetical protein
VAVDAQKGSFPGVVDGRIFLIPLGNRVCVKKSITDTISKRMKTPKGTRIKGPIGMNPFFFMFYLTVR